MASIQIFDNIYIYTLWMNLNISAKIEWNKILIVMREKDFTDLRVDVT